MNIVEIVLITLVVLIFYFLSTRNKKNKAKKTSIAIRLTIIVIVLIGYIWISSALMVLFYDLIPTTWFSIIIKYIISPILTLCIFSKPLNINYRKIKLKILNKINEIKYKKN